MKNLSLKSIKHLASRFLGDEQGQSTTEYILILSVVVMIAMKFKQVFKTQMDQAVGKLGENINGALSETN